jgi:hypothetical protein
MKPVNIMSQYILAIVELVLLISASLGISFFMLKREWIDSIVEFLVTRMILGFGIIAYATFFAAVFGFLNLYFFIGVILLGNIFLVMDRGMFRGFSLRLKFSLYGVLLGLFVAVNFFYVWFPPTFYDSMMYHLAVPDQYIQAGGMIAWPTNFFAHLPLNVEMVFLFSMLGKTVLLPKLIAFVSGVALVLMMLSWYRRQFSMGFHQLPMLLFFTIPQVGFLTATSKPDIPAILALMAGLLMFNYYLDKPENKRFLILTGLLWGFGLGGKYIFAFYLLGFGLAFLILKFKGFDFKKKFTAMLIVGLIVAACLLPWLVKNTIYMGNPVYPYLNSVFPNDLWSPEQAESFSAIQARGTEYSLLDLLYFPIEMFIKPYAYGMTVVFGVLFLLFIPFLLFTKADVRLRFMMVAALVAFVILMMFSKVPRYFLVSFLLLSMPMANGYEVLARRIQPVKKFMPVVLALLLLMNLAQTADLHERYSKGASFVYNSLTDGFKIEDPNYHYYLPYYRAAEFANRQLSQHDRILVYGDERVFYFKIPVLAGSFVDQNLLSHLLKNERSVDAVLQGLQREGITHILYSPQGLERFGKKCFIYKLTDAEQALFNELLSRLRPLYRDKFYQLLQLP